MREDSGIARNGFKMVVDPRVNFQPEPRFRPESHNSQHLPSCPSLSHISSSARGSSFTNLFECSVILGRAIKTEYLALGTLFGTVGLSMGLSGGSKDTKPKTIEQVKESVGLNASSK